jgi:hypothetical protein
VKNQNITGNDSFHEMSGMGRIYNPSRTRINSEHYGKPQFDLNSCENNS